MQGNAQKYGSMKYRSRHLPKGALIEFVPRGAYVKVSAVDPVSHEEVSIVGDPRRGSEALSVEAVRKLEFVLARKRGAKTGKTPSDKGPVVRGRRSENPSGWDL